MNAYINLKIAPLFLVVLFSVLRLYEYLWAYTKLPSQYLIWIAGILFLVMRVAFCRKHGWRITHGEKIVLAYYLIICICLAVHVIALNPQVDMDGRNSFLYTRNMTFIGSFWLLAGGALSFAKLKSSNFLAFIVFLPTPIFILSAMDGSFGINYGLIRLRMGIDSVSHLTLAEFVVFLSAFAYVFSPKYKLVYLFLAILLIFILGGRSSFYLFIISMAAYEFLLKGGRAIIELVVVALAALLLFYIFSSLPILNVDDKLLSDMFFSDGIQSDNSFSNRWYYFFRGTENLPQQFLFGDPGLIASTTGAMGDYMHNIVSAWQFFGFFFFLLIIYIFYKSTRIMVRMIRSKDESRTHHLAAIMLIYTFLSLLASKSIVFKWMWFSIGFWLLNYNQILLYYKNRFHN